MSLPLRDDCVHLINEKYKCPTSDLAIDLCEVPEAPSISMKAQIAISFVFSIPLTRHCRALIVNLPAW